MNTHQLLDLNDCTEFRQRLEAKTPPAVTLVMVTLLLLVAGITAWALFAKASLVVIAPGRVRPTETPHRVFAATSPYLEGRVAEAHVKEGEYVRQGQLLVRLDTSQIDNQIAKQSFIIDSATDELVELRKLSSLLDERTQVAKQQATAELEHLIAEFRRANQRRASEIRQAKAALSKSQDHARRTQLLFAKKVAAEASVIEAQTQLRQDQEALRQAELPLDDGAIAARRQSLQLIDREHQLKHAELAARIAAKEGEINAAQKELANREYERGQAELCAPIDGVVVAGNVKVGDLLERGKPVLEIATEKSLQFQAMVNSEDVGDLRIGMPVNLKLDAYDFQKFGTLSGQVTYISPDSQLPDAVSGGKAFYQVKIQLRATRLGRGKFAGEAKLGMAGTAEIVTSHESLLAIFTQQMRKSIRIE